LYTTKTAEFNY